LNLGWKAIQPISGREAGSCHDADPAFSSHLLIAASERETEPPGQAAGPRLSGPGGVSVERRGEESLSIYGGVSL
jgi:hypothetical protein